MQMEHIRRSQRQAREQGWSFEHHLADLRALGVRVIRMKLASGETEYTDDNGETLIDTPLEAPGRECALEIDPRALEAARRSYLERKIDLEAFFDRLASAGVWYYELDARTGAVKHYDWREQLQDAGYIAS